MSSTVSDAQVVCNKCGFSQRTIDCDETHALGRCARDANCEAGPAEHLAVGLGSCNPASLVIPDLARASNVELAMKT